MMRIRSLAFAFAGVLAALSFQAGAALAQAADALTGQVSSEREGAMEGVVVSARKAGSIVTVSVVTDATGHYRFPAARLEPGSYTLAIRAAG
jgi:virginiamycin B lyase